MGKKLSEEMVLVKKTKGAYRMEEEGFTNKSGDYAFGTLYIRKEKLDVTPAKIKVTVEILETEEE